MLRLFLRVFVLAISGLCVALWLTPFVLQHYYADEANNYFHDALRGPFGTIVEQLEPLPEAGRAQHVQELTQRYNWKMSLRDPLSEPVSEIERDQLLAGQFISRDDQQEFMVPVPASATARAQWLFVRMPQSPEIGWRVISVGLMAISVVVGGFLLLWVWPTWRDLEALTLAARRMGEGDLKVRARVSGFSGVGRLAGHFNQMSDRIAALIGRQRELTNAVSHELRTPISRLSFELDLLAQEGTTDSGRALIRDMHDDLRELDELVAELLLHARLEHPHEDAPLEPVPTGPWLEQCLAQVALEARARGLDCALVAYPAQEVLLHPRFMNRALVNLLRNALRYAQTRVQVSLQLDVDGNARLYVEDDGPGIAPTDRLRVLQPFTRLDESRDRATGGTGLGLAIVERVARWHQGRLSIDDSPSLGGARVMLEWPQAH